MSEINRDCGFSDEQVESLAIAVAGKQLSMPRVWGDHQRVHCGVGVELVNTLFNTSSGEIYIGDYSFFGHNVTLLTGTHNIRKRGLARHTAIPAAGRDIRIGNGVWICSNVTVIGPCTIGDDAVIAAGSVVIGSDLPGGFIYAGTPARQIRRIDFEDAGVAGAEQAHK